MHDRLPRTPGLIIIPAHNEEESIAEVLADIRDHSDLDVAVVDDASADRTVEIAWDNGAVVLPLPFQMGAWAALQTGLRYAARHHYEYAITLDADGQHEACHLGELCAPVLYREADIAIGACTSRGSSARQVAWVLLRAVSGLSVADITSGFRAYNRRAIELLASRNCTLLEFQDVGVLRIAQLAGLRIAEVEVSMRPRLRGHSRVFYSWAAVAYYMIHSLVLGFSKRAPLRRSQNHR